MKELKVLLLAAGLGTRLLPLTINWPKCLMPIGERPLLEYWLQNLFSIGINKVLVNLHHHSEIVAEFLNRSCFEGMVECFYEKKLLGTAGTFLANKDFFKDETSLIIHADNWCQCDFKEFLVYHRECRPRQCVITMMTFETTIPHKSGIIESDEQGIVRAFHEKVLNPPGKIANGAVYLFEPEVLEWLQKYPNITDFSTEVLPKFLGLIATWHNKNIHRDIGSLPILKQAQLDPKPSPLWAEDLWQKQFKNNPIHKKILVGKNISASK